MRGKKGGKEDGGAGTSSDRRRQLVRRLLDCFTTFPFFLKKEEGGRGGKEGQGDKKGGELGEEKSMIHRRRGIANESRAKIDRQILR